MDVQKILMSKNVKIVLGIVVAVIVIWAIYSMFFKTSAADAAKAAADATKAAADANKATADANAAAAKTACLAAAGSDATASALC